MPRIGEFDVRQIFEYPDDELNTDAFINAASSIVDSVCLDSGYSEEKLTLIETWLTAHLVAIKHQIPSSQSVGGEVSESYQYTLSLNLNSTMYGQQAMLIDTDGNLAALNKKMKEGTFTGSLSASWLGIASNEGVPYV